MKTSLIFLAIGMFAVGCNTFLFAGLLPQMGQTIGQSVAVTGQGLSIFSLTYLLSAPLFSVILANKPVKRIIQIALTVFILGNLFTIISQNLTLFLIGRALAGIGAGIFTPLCIAVAVHLVDASAKGRALSFVWGANSAGVVFGVPLGLYLATSFRWQVSIAYLIALCVITLAGFSLQKADLKLPESPSLGARLRLMADPKTLAVMGVTCFTAAASLGLYSFVSLVQSGSPNSLSLALFCWGLGGFIGSSMIGSFIDRTKKPRVIMALVLVGLMFSFCSIPFTKNLPYVGLIPFFMWGIFGWAVPTPQQHVLFELHEGHGSILAALNSSCLGLGAVVGTMLGGLIISFGFKESYLPFPAAALVLCVLIGQLILINNSNKVRCLVHE
jgi:predicted MFS family arabinose efflux permease